MDIQNHWYGDIAALAHGHRVVRAGGAGTASPRGQLLNYRGGEHADRLD